MFHFYDAANRLVAMSTSAIIAVGDVLHDTRWEVMTVSKLRKSGDWEVAFTIRRDDEAVAIVFLSGYLAAEGVDSRAIWGLVMNADGNHHTRDAAGAASAAASAAVAQMVWAGKRSSLGDES